MQRERLFPAVANTELIVWAGAVVTLLLVLYLKLLAALLAGLLVYELVQVLAARLKLASIGRNNAKLMAVALLTASVVVLLTATIIGLASALRHGSDSLPALLQKLAEIIDNSRQRLPQSVNDYLPADADELRERVTSWLRLHSGELGGAGVIAGRLFARILAGMVIGALLALYDPAARKSRAPLAAVLAAHAARLATAFRRVVFAQTWIAAINTGITAIFLLILLPLFGAHPPLTKTLLALTFFAGLIPIVGNLVSNSAVVIVCLSVSMPVAISALVFLIAAHKLQYFLNARIIGGQISASAWELLLAMLVMEAAFGIAGVIAAPIYYAYIKNELAEKGLV
jgi:predicted PurR-regulated permease PerM